MKMDLFGLTADGWSDSISAAEAENLVPDVSNDKGSIVLRKRDGYGSFTAAGTSDKEYIEIYSVNTSLDFINGDFTNRLYFIFYGTASIPSAGATDYWLGVYYWNGSSNTMNEKLLQLTGATGDFSNFTHDASAHGGKVVIADRGANTTWVVTMDNDPSLDSAVAYTLPTGWAIQYLDFQDGFFVGNIKDTSSNNVQRKIVCSDFGATTFTSTNFYLRTGGASNILRVLSDKREIWGFCDDAIFVLSNIGAEGFPFQRNPSVYIDNGLLAPDTLAKADDQIFFVGKSPNGGAAIYKTEGYNVIDITPKALVSTLTATSSAIRYVYKAFGNVIKSGDTYVYRINALDSAFGTWAYDIKTGLWHKHTETNAIGTYTSSHTGRGTSFMTKTSGNYPINQYVMMHYKTILASGGSVNSQFLRTVSGSDRDVTYATSGTPADIYCRAISKHIDGEDNNWLVHNRVLLEFEPQTDMAVTLYYSDDNGASWTTVSTITTSTGRYEWRCLGKSRDRLYKLENISMLNVVLLNSYLDIKLLAH